MNKRSRAGTGVVAAICVCFGFGCSEKTQARSSVPDAVLTWADMATHARGTFEVKLTPQPPEDKAEDASLGRMIIDKKFHGDLEATSKGQMLTTGTALKVSAGYVAIEKVTGTLHGRTGTFVLQHSGTITRGHSQLTVTVVPDSGTGQLAGIAGKMMIIVTDGRHSYAFEYTLPETD